ncbi:MAG: ribonuclease HII [Prochloraceae cyanobacterium]
MQALIAGVDEVGRGALFGPVVAAAAVVPISGLPELVTIGVKDSKQLGAKKRSELVQPIQGTVKSWALGYATVEEIDRLNILQASLLAMKRAVLKLRVQPEMCLVDGKQPIPELPLPQKNLVKGDRRSPIIAAASILAKVWRDELIVRLAGKYSHYDLASNKGYGTKRHLLALQEYGPSPQHRMSFRSCRVD